MCFLVIFQLELALFMTDSEDPTGKLKDEQLVKKRREEALPERILRRVLEGMGGVVDRRLGRTVEPRPRTYHLKAHRTNEAVDR